MKKIIRIADIVFAVVLTIIFSFVLFGNFLLPNTIVSYSDRNIYYNSVFSVKSRSDASVDFQDNDPVSVQTEKIKLFGIIPVKDASVAKTTTKKVYVSGDSFGIKLYTDGVIVVGTRDVSSNDGKCNPARQAGIEKGDIIVEINGEKIYTSSQVEKLLNDNNGKEYKLKIKRDETYKNFTLVPVYSPREGCYKVGLWVRDSTAGIGTITFFNPENKTIVALGHPITDVDTNEIMPILNGEAVRAKVTKLYKSKSGETGSLCCDFSNDTIATLNKNKNSGIYGNYTCDVSSYPLYEVAPAQDVERGHAQILCTLDGGGPQLYSVDISRISYRENNNDKNMVVKITDKRLLEKTGGIVQGMSGSPIIQNGKLIGALTHVIVDNPEKGYGIFAQKMVEQSELGG